MYNLSGLYDHIDRRVIIWIKKQQQKTKTKFTNLETWHEALMTGNLQMMYKLLPLVDIDLFHGNVKFGRIHAFECGFKIKMRKLAANDQSIRKFLLLKESKWPLPGAVCM